MKPLIMFVLTIYMQKHQEAPQTRGNVLETIVKGGIHFNSYFPSHTTNLLILITML